MDQFDPKKYLDIAFRRKYWIILTLLLTVLAGLTYLLVVPKIFESKTLILVQPQRVPQNYVRSLIVDDIDFNLEAIIRQVTSGSSLTKIIREHQLYRDLGKTISMAEKVALMRMNIKIERGYSESASRGRPQPDTAYFSITFTGEHPQKIRDVTNRLASEFITENLKLRESESIGTTVFLADEIKSVAKQLSEKEEEIKNYREKYMGNLPEQLQGNLHTLARLEAQLEAFRDGLRDAHNRKIVIEGQIEEERRNFFLGLSTGFNVEVKDIPSLKNLLMSLKVRYTDSHPDVIRLRELIADLESKQSKSSSTSNSSREGSWLVGVSPSLKRQLANNELRIKSLEADIGEIKSQIISYQKKVEQTPLREQELRSLNRDYEHLRGLYDSLLKKKLEANLAVSMEMQQKGQQYRILDPASLPFRPIKPNVVFIVAFTLMLGLGSGVGLALFREMMDTSFKTPEEAEKELQMPVLLSIPFHHTKKERMSLKIKGILKATSVAVGFVICFFGIAVGTKGLDTTLAFAKNLLDESITTFSNIETSLLRDKSQNPPAK